MMPPTENTFGKRYKAPMTHGRQPSDSVTLPIRWFSNLFAIQGLKLDTIGPKAGEVGGNSR